MIRTFALWSVALVLSFQGGSAARAQTLGVGDSAPKIEVKEFVKGDAVKEFEKGKTYVVEFWATWCGPCRVSIPHLTELQKKHKDIKFIGVSVWENEPDKVKPFVKEMGDKMDYAVAMDDVPKDAKGADGKMAKNWMTAAEQNGIPSAFVVGGEGKIMWIGHPMELDKVLDKVSAGTFDLAAAIKEHKEAMEKQEKLKAVQQKLSKAQAKGESALLKAIDEIIADDPSLEEQLAPAKFMMLVRVKGKEKQAVEFASKLIDERFKDNAEILNVIAWTIVDPDAGKRDAELVAVALKAAIRADKISEEKNGAIADTLAKAYFDSKEFAKAVETQERAIKLTPDAPDELKDRLKQYREALEKKSEK